MELGGHIVLDLQEPVKPLLLLRPGGRVRHGRGLGAGAGGVDEGEQGVKPHLLHQGHGVHGLRLRLAGEADDDVGGQYQPGHDPLGVVHQIQVLLPGVAAIHLFQDPVVAGLEGQVQLLGHMRACGHHVKQPGRGVLGVAGHEADEIFSRDPVDVRQQVGEVVVQIQIVAVGVHVLAQQGDVLVPRLHQLPDLRQHGLGVPAPLPAPDVGHDAVGAEVVASVHDGDPGLHALLPHHGDALGNGAVLVLDGKDPLLRLIHLPQKLRELPQGLGAEHQIHVGIGLFDPLRHSGLLGHAAAQADHLLRILLLGVGQGAQVAEHPVLRVLPDGAGVQEHQIGLLRVLGEGEAACLQYPHELLSVRHILLAAEGVHTGRGVSLPGGEQAADLLLKLPLAVQVRLGDQYVFAFQISSSKCRYFN